MMNWLLFLGLLWTPSLCQEYLLPVDVVPHHYDVHITYDIDPTTNFSYFGVVDILVSIKEATSKIVLHAEDFDLPKNGIRLQGPTATTVKEVKLNDTYNLLTIALDRELEAGENYTLTIPFYGNLKMGLDGAYISSYVDQKTQTKEYLIVTQFEAISARKAFPCFDEPIYKATYKVVLGHHKDFTAIGNMPLQHSSKENPTEEQWPWTAIADKFKKVKSNFVWDHFETSVPMSTYLVAYVISKFTYVESPRELSTTKFRIWANKDAIDQTSYASLVGPKVLTHFENWFNVSFPLPKQDMIAIPDFSAGAMENWGLITYRETQLLYDKEQSSLTNKERVAEVIAHELAHQWFGNLVTMKWWSDLWLNEGFATFVASIGTTAIDPSWDSLTVHGIYNILSVLKFDALESSHPMSVPLNDPKRISEIFDNISYQKGATLIRMMTLFLGEDVFREAINKYLVKYSYKNAEQDNLWQELTEVSHRHGVLKPDITVKEIMDTWTTQTGYPLLTVTRDYTDNSLALTQKRYLSLSAKSTTSTSWWVPLRVLSEREASSGAKTPALQWLTAHEGVTSEHKFQHDAKADEWLLFNSDMIALYRVNYDNRNWQLLTEVLLSDKYKQVPLLGRVQLLSDAFALASTNRLDYTIALKLASYIQREQDYLPIYTALEALSKIDNVLKRNLDYGAFQKYVRKLIGGTYAKSGGLATKKILNPNDLKSVKTQVLLSEWACRMKVPGCEENAMQLFEQWMSTPNPDVNNPIPLDLRAEVYCVGIARGSVRHWRFLLARKQRANVAAARNNMLIALTCSKEVWILNQYLEWTITDNSEVRRQDSAFVIMSIMRNSVGYYVAKDFFYNRIEDIYNAFKGQGRTIGRIVTSLLNEFTAERELEEFMSWYKVNKKYLEDSTLSVSQGIEKAKVNLDWIAKNERLVVDKLREVSMDEMEDAMLYLSYSSDGVKLTQCHLFYLFFIVIVLFT